MAATHHVHTPFFHEAPAAGHAGAQVPEGALAMGRLLVVSLAWGAASVPAFVAGYEAGGWCLGLMALLLVVRFPMTGACAVLGGGAYLVLTAAALLAPDLVGGEAGILSPDPWMRACAILTAVASVLSVALLDPRTFQHTFRKEGRPVATWQSTLRR